MSSTNHNARSAAAAAAISGTTGDASVKAVFAKMNELEAQRRTLMIQRQEAQTRAEQTSAELRAKQQEGAQHVAKETELVRRLREAVAAGAQLKTQVEKALDKQTKAAADEPVLLAAAERAKGEADAKQAHWHKKRARLEAMAEAWGGIAGAAAGGEEPDAARTTTIPPYAAAAVAEVEGLDAQLAKAEAAADDAEARLYRARQAAPDHATPAKQQSNVGAGAPPATAASLATLKAALEAETAALAEDRSTTARRVHAVGREVATMTTRVAELEAWAAEIDGGRKQLAEHTAQLTAAKASGLCQDCDPAASLQSSGAKHDSA